VVIFYNVVIFALLNYMHRNSILHTVVKLCRIYNKLVVGVTNEQAHRLCKKNNKYKLAVGMVNVVGTLWLFN
jgi:uncharacterized membrane protein